MNHQSLLDAPSGVVHRSIDPSQFRRTMRRFASGVTVVTSVNDGLPDGATVSSFCSVSLDPPLVLVCLGHESSTHRTIDRSGRFAVNILPSSAKELALFFATRAPDKFADVRHRPGLLGLPLLSGATASVECEVANSFAEGDHTIFVGRVVAGETRPDTDPLIYFESGFHGIAAPASEPS